MTRASPEHEVCASTADPSKSRDVGQWVLVGLVLAGAMLRLNGLGASRLNYDESFTAMAGRLPIGSLFGFLARNDSHPPLDYLIHLPLARAGVSEFWFRFPSAVFSIAALALFAWWVRGWGRVGIIACALMAINVFEITHGREARMYAELELLGIAIAMVAFAWLQRPRRSLAIAIGALVFLGLVTHVSMFLVATGLLLIPGRRSDRDAWWWRGSVGAAGVGWALLWAPSFVLQARGGHSSWIPHTTPVTLVNAIAHLVTSVPTLALATVSAIAAGGLVIVRRRGPLGKLWIAGFLVPIAVAAVAGLVEPVVLDRTFTLIAWAPMVAVAVALDALMRRSIAAGAIVAIAATAVILPAAFDQTQIMTGSNGALRALERRVRPGDIVAVQPASKAPELQWSLGVRRRSRITPVPMPGVPNSFAIHYGHDAESSGRLLILDLRKRHTETGLVASRCDSSSSSLHPHISCLAFARPHEHIPDA